MIPLSQQTVAFVENGNGDAQREQFVETDLAAELDRLEDVLLERFGKLPTHEAIKAIATWHQEVLEAESQKTQARIFRGCISLLINCKTPKLLAHGMAFASGLQCLIGLTMTEASVKLGVTKAAVSKVTVKVCDMFGLPRSRYMKTEKAAEAYRKRAIEVHRRNKQ